ncbi:MAG: hypothetical protein HRU09_06725 [Oligoflexales bacterium]|nr:hypothetical protein [Oligoflexales bacterium]
MSEKLPEHDPIVVKLSDWFKENNEDYRCLLPQNLPEDLLTELSTQAKACLGQEGNAPAPLVAVGLIVSNGKSQFKASREQLAVSVKAYSFNLVMESLRRSNLLTFSKEFDIENVLDMSFEREFQLTDLGRQAASKAGSELNSLFKV